MHYVNRGVLVNGVQVTIDISFTKAKRPRAGSSNRKYDRKEEEQAELITKLKSNQS